MHILIKYFLTLAYKLKLIYWKIVSPRTLGVRTILIKNDKVILVKHTYQNKWYFPGGGILKGERLDQAAKREATEEAGVKIKNMKLFGVYTNFHESKNDHITVFLSKSFKVTKNKSIEIEKVQEFNINKLPYNVSSGTKRRIEEYKKGKSSNFGRW